MARKATGAGHVREVGVDVSPTEDDSFAGKQFQGYAPPPFTSKTGTRDRLIKAATGGGSSNPPDETMGGSSVTVSPRFGTGGPGAKSRQSGADLHVGDTWDRQS